jgi:hypothetical protein
VGSNDDVTFGSINEQRTYSAGSLEGLVSRFRPALKNAWALRRRISRGEPELLPADLPRILPCMRAIGLGSASRSASQTGTGGPLRQQAREALDPWPRGANLVVDFALPSHAPEGQAPRLIQKASNLVVFKPALGSGSLRAAAKIKVPPEGGI